MKRLAAIACLVLCCGTGSIEAQEAASKSTSAGVFTEEQAKQGAIAYNANCASCHGAQLRSTDREIPHLTDKAYKFSWEGKSIAEKFETVRTTMPPREERSLDDRVYLEIVTYILRFNGVPVGSKPLELDPKTLSEILISAPPN
jgi:mono/diheme cytochrome c family protein